MTTKRRLILVSLAALAAATAQAETTVNERRPALPNGIVSIDNAAGSLTIQGWDQAEVSVTGRIGKGADGLTLETQDGRTTIKLDLRYGPTADATLEVRVPAGSTVEVEGFAVEARVSGVKGALRVETVNGSVKVEAAGGALELNTVNGPIDVSGASSSARIEAVNGEVTLRGVNGDVEASAVNGRLRVEGGTFTRATFETVSAGIDVQGALAPRGRLSLQSVSGDVALTLPADVAAAFQVSTMSGTIDNELGPAAKPADSRFMPRKELDFTTGAGTASVEIQTLSGSVRLRKR